MADGPRESRPRTHVRWAWVVAISADAVQWLLWPLVAAGAVSPLNDAIDVGVGVVMIRLLGWHWAFLPAFFAELVPGVDLVPTWTAAVFLATRGGTSRNSPS